MSRGVLLMIAASLCFTLMVACVKAARAELDTRTIIAWRGFISVPLTMLLLRSASLRIKNVRVLTMLCVLGMTAMYGFYTAAFGLPLTELSFIHRLQPILIAVFAPLLLGAGERVGASIWGVLFAGILGCGILLGPQFAMGNTYGLWALVGTTASASAHLCVRALAPTEHPIAVAFYFQLFVLVVALLVLTATGGSPFTISNTTMIWFLVGTGVFSAGGQMFMTSAYHVEKAAVVGAATYLGPVFGLAMDIVAFGVVPGWQAFVGGIVIIVASIQLLRTSSRSVS